MSDTTIVAVPAAPASSYIDWAPVIGGALVASALSFVLFAFGSAAGVASVSPFSYNNPSGTTLGIIAVVWVLIVMIGSLMAGGYFAGRLRRPLEIVGDERELRDGVHGLLVWAVSLLIGITLGFMAAGAATRGAAAVVGGAASTAASGVAAAASNEQLTGAIDSMLRAAPRAGEAARGEDPRAEFGRIISRSLARGDVSAEDRTYMAQVVAARAGVPEDEARRRVEAAIAQARQAAETAKQAAERARKMAAILAFLLGAASIVSAGAAYWGATMGGKHRDDMVLGRA